MPVRIRGVYRGSVVESFFNLIQIFISLLIVAAILSQVKDSGGGLFGAATSTGRTRRGLEKTLFQLTIGLAAVFLLISIISVRVA